MGMTLETAGIFGFFVGLFGLTETYAAKMWNKWVGPDWRISRLMINLSALLSAGLFTWICICISKALTEMDEIQRILAEDY